MSLKFVSLFAGIGGIQTQIDLGLERAGFECVGQVEIDDYCNKVLARHWPNVPRIRDVRDFHGTEFGQFDMLTGGYPCPPFSVAGKRLGEKDPRHLWPEVLRIIRNVRPRLVLLENVAGHLSLGFERVQGDLAESGYASEWDCIPAAAVGAPHRRDRVFIVAHAEGEHGYGRDHNARECLERGSLSKSRDGSGSEDVAYSKSGRWNERPHGHRPSTLRGGREVLDAVRRSNSSEHGGIWATEPGVGRVADGVPHRVDRLRALGNSVVPAVAEFIGRQIKAAA